MRIAILSDTHSQHNLQHLPIKMPQCDLIIHAGDCTGNGSIAQTMAFLRWFEQFKTEKILVPGNHDWLFEENLRLIKHETKHLKNLHILTHDSLELFGTKFFGTSYQPIFYDWAFNRSNATRRILFDKIPENTEVLITHVPPRGVLDTNSQDERRGDLELSTKIKHLPKLNLHAFGHNHEGYGQMLKDNILYVNGSVCNIHYVPVNPIQVIEYGSN